MSQDRRLLYGITNWALFAAGLANLGAGTWAAFTAAPTLAATSLTAGLVLLFAATIDRFESFKGLGIEAKTRQLDQKISQADDALKRLREMTELTSSALININCKIGRWDSAPEPRDFIALADRIRNVMQSVGSNEDSILSTLAPWARTLCFDMARAKTIDLHNILTAKVQTLEKERQAINQPIQANDPHHLRISEEMRTLREFQQYRLLSFHKLNLEDFPDKFMSVFSDVPMLEEDVLRPLRAEAAKFAPGMESLVKSRKIVDRELWIEALNARRES